MAILNYLGEEWRDINGFDYQVSNFGRIKRKNCIVNSRYGRYHVIKERIISQQMEKNEYLSCALSKEGKVKRFFVHRLVALAFPEICGEWFEGAEIDHINTIRNDNRAENLRFVDRKTNQNNPLSIVNRSKSQKLAVKKYGLAAKPVIQYSLNGELIKEWKSASEAGRINGYNFKQISACCTGRHKTAYGYIWKYK